MAHVKIPKEDFVFEIIRDIVRRRGIVETQNELSYLVSRKLKNFNPEFTISERRIKKLVLKSKEIKIKIKTRKSRDKKLNKCPICRGKLIKTYIKNLVNKKVQIGYSCRRCGFNSKIDSLSPSRYIFVWKG